MNESRTVTVGLDVHARSIRLADGPDEVHRDAIARLELGKARS